MQLFAVALIAMCFARATAMPVNSRDSSGNQPSQRSGIDRGADSWLTTFTLPASFYVLNKWYGPSVKAGRNKLTSTTKFDIPKDVQDKALEDETCFIAEETQRPDWTVEQLAEAQKRRYCKGQQTLPSTEPSKDTQKAPSSPDSQSESAAQSGSNPFSLLPQVGSALGAGLTYGAPKLLEWWSRFNNGGLTSAF